MVKENLDAISKTSKKAVLRIKAGVSERLAYQPVKEAVVKAFEAGISPEAVDLEMRDGEQAAKNEAKTK